MDLTGKRFRYLTIIKRTSKNNRGSVWLCKCDCGNEVILPTTHLVGTKNRREIRVVVVKLKGRMVIRINIQNYMQYMQLLLKGVLTQRQVIINGMEGKVCQ